MQRQNTAFQTQDNLTLRGWLYTPSTSHQPHPCIIMTHGFTALKEHQLDRFARVFCEQGFTVLAYDQRNFGESDGEPRFDIDPMTQVKDLSAAITFVQTLPNVDPNKIGLWGNSFSGGNVLVAGALDKRVKAIVAQVPFVEGYHQQMRMHHPERFAKIEQQYAKEALSLSQGHPPRLIPVVTADSEQPAVMKLPDAYAFFTSVSTWENKVTFCSVQRAGDYRPVDFIQQISPIPVLWIVAREDTVNLTALALQAYEQAPAPKELLMIDGDHFAPFGAAFTRCSEAATGWFDKYLKSA